MRPLLSRLIVHPGVWTGTTTRHGTIGDFRLPPERKIILMKQVHGDTVVAVDRNSPDLVRDCDAIYSRDPTVVLAVKTADCLPILLFHPAGLIAAIHAGRRSTERHLLERVLRIFRQEFGISEGLYIWFGPSIHGTCYQVDRETNRYCDLIAENYAQLLSVFDPQTCMISHTYCCTHCRTDTFFSYRQEGEKAGRLLAAIGGSGDWGRTSDTTGMNRVL